jgi:hypothetical protein
MASLRRGLARIPAWVVDAGRAVAVAVAVTIAIRVAREPGASPRPARLRAGVDDRCPATGPAALAGGGAGGIVCDPADLLRLELPGHVGGVAAGGGAVYPASAGYLRWALLVAAWLVAGPIVFRLFVDPEPVLPVLAELLRDAALWLAILLLGDAVHSRRALSRAYRLLEVERARRRGCCATCCPSRLPVG